MAYCQNKNGDIGYLCKDLNKMKSILLEMKNDPEKVQARRIVQAANLLKIGENSALDSELRLVMEQTGW